MSVFLDFCHGRTKPGVVAPGKCARFTMQLIVSIMHDSTWLLKLTKTYFRACFFVVIDCSYNSKFSTNGLVWFKIDTITRLKNWVDFKLKKVQAMLILQSLVLLPLFSSRSWMVISHTEKKEWHVSCYFKKIFLFYLN